MTQVIFYINPSFGEKGLRCVDQIFTTQYQLSFLQKGRINQLGIYEKEFAKGYYQTILLLFCLND